MNEKKKTKFRIEFYFKLKKIKEKKRIILNK